MKAIVADFSLGKEVWSRLRAKLFGTKNRSRGLSLNLVEMPEPKLVAPDWVKIRTIVSGISDMDEGMILSNALSPFAAFVSFPFVPGNENLGLVTDVGSDVKGIEPGERVVLTPLLSCEPRGVEPLCPSCSRGEPTACRNFGDGVIGPGVMIGACRDTAGGWGDTFIAHQSQVRPIPQNLESEQAILVPEFTRALRAVLQHPPASEDRVLIVGAGSLGLLTLRALRLLGHEVETTVIAQHSFQADPARRFGASAVIGGAGPGRTYEEVADHVDGQVRYPEVGRITMGGGADLVFETTGHAVTIGDAISFTGEGKKLVLMGVNQPVGLDITPLWFKGIQLRGTLFSGTEHYKGEITSTFDVAMDLLSLHGLPAAEMVTHKFPLEHHLAAFSALADRSGAKALKVVFQHVV